MKYLWIIFLLNFLIYIGYAMKDKKYCSAEPNVKYPSQTDLKAKAFTVLQNKCNICHATKKRTDIFTLENMDSLAADIHKQVFLKKKMPKGKKVKLTKGESEALQQWLTSILDE